MIVASFPKFGTGAVAWIALAPLLVGIGLCHGRCAARLGYVTGVISSLGLLYWTGLVVAQFGGLGPATSTAAVVLLALVAGLFGALFGGLVGHWVRSFGTWALNLAPLAWTAVELLRRHTLLEFPWCLLGYSQHDFLPVVQIASVTGVYGVSFLLVAVPGAAAVALLDRGRQRRWTGLVVAGALWGAVLVFGAYRLARPVEGAGRVRVGLVQASIPQDEKWDVDKLWRNIERHEELTREAARAGAQLVAWPESAVPFFFDDSPVVAARLRRLVREEQVHLLFGNDDRSTDGAGRVWVGAKLLAPDGQLKLRYHKMQLVPFGEYVPLEGLLGWIGVRKLVEEVGAFSRGSEASVASAGTAKVGVTVCYEAIFPDLVRRFAAGGAELLVNVTNDGWYGRTSAPYQHFAMARLRAVENGRSLARAANTGISALVDPRGRVLARTELFERRALVGDLPLAQEQTWYGRHGDVFAWFCLAATAALTLGAAALGRRGVNKAL